MFTHSISLGNIGSEAQAKKIKDKLQGQTFYNFEVQMSPMMGNWPVEVMTEYEGATLDEFKDMVLYVLASEL